MINEETEHLVSKLISSQNDLNPCNDGKRSSDVLIETINKCERLQKQLDIAVETLKKYASNIALTYNDGSCYGFRFYNDNGREAQKALKEIEELI